MDTTRFDEQRAAALAQPESLRRELARAFEGVAHGDAFVGYRCGERVAGASARGAESDAALARAPIRIGCVAKLLTATLARRAFAAGRLVPDEPVARALGTDALRGVTVRQLLEHTHGLDDSRVETMPRSADMRVDVDALMRAVCAAPRLAPPGAIYSYGSAGAWLVAALLEHVDGRAYAEQVREDLFAPLGVQQLSESSVPMCPATGAALALDPVDLLEFVARAAFEDPDSWSEDGRPGALGAISVFPGWCPLERGVHLGWKYHGRGWFGHQSAWPAASLLVRAHPRRALAFVVASREHSAAVIAARVFAAHLPELFDLRIPVQSSAAPPDRHIGVFASAAWSVAIRDRDGALELHAERRGARHAQRGSLRRAAGGVLFTRPAVESFPHVELVTLDSGSAYLWNGRFVLPRLASRAR